MRCDIFKNGVKCIYSIHVENPNKFIKFWCNSDLFIKKDRECGKSIYVLDFPCGVFQNLKRL